MYCYHCGTEVDQAMKFCPVCGADLSIQEQDTQPLEIQRPEVRMPENQRPEVRMPVQEEHRKKKSSVMPLLLIPLFIAVAALVVVGIFVYQYSKVKTAGSDITGTVEEGSAADPEASAAGEGDAQAHTEDASEAAADPEPIGEKLQALLLGSMQAEDLAIAGDSAQAAIVLPCCGEYMLQAYEKLASEEALTEEAYASHYLEELEELLDAPDAETKRVEVSVSVPEAAGEITGSAKYLETHDLKEAEAYTPSEEELSDALKQKALDQEIQWFQAQLWVGAEIPQEEIIPDIAKAGVSS